MKIKRVIAVAATLLIAVLFCGCSGSKNELIQPTNEFYVNDLANVITEADSQEMLSRAVALQQKTTAQVVVVTVEDLDGKEISDYALELGRSWGVGDENEDNGVVILLSENDREIYIAVGYGLEGALPDSKTGRIIDSYGLQYLREDNFSKGLLEVSKAIINETYIEYGQEPEAGYVPIELLSQTENEDEGSIKILISWVILIIIIILFSRIFGRRRGGFIWLGGGFGHGGFSSGFNNRKGGGFGGFSGGGGSFGGGGSGRSF